MKTQPYILNTKNISEKDLELVGREAVENSFIIHDNIPIPPSFVVTSIAFDDFLTSAGIVDKIAGSLKNVRPFIKQTARDASHEIQSYILSAKFSSILTEPISQAYQNLTGVNDQPLVSMYPSNIIEPEFIPAIESRTKNIVIKGTTDLLYYIKLTWLSLFSTEAIEYRTNNYYKGPLSLAVIIQKTIRSEISGKMYTIPPITQEKNKIEIKAVYGVEEVTPNVNFADIYTVSRSDLKILEKKIFPQDTMLVRKLKIEKNEDPNFKVEISDFWKKNQKLEDNKIIKLAGISKNIHDIFHTDVEVNWAIEAGDLYITSMRILELPVLKPKDEKAKEDLPTLNIESKKEAQDAKKENAKPDIKKLSEEVKAIVEGSSPEPTTDSLYTSLNDQTELPDLPKRESKLVLPKITIEKDQFKGSFSYFEDFDFLTSIYLDISSMNSRLLSVLKYFSGSFFDGTEMILSNNILPEEFSGNNYKLNELIEKYSLDISTATKAGGQKPLVYQFSTISEYELKLLGIEDNRYKYNYDERFLDYPDSMAVEALAIKKARNDYGARNLKICFSGVRSLDNLNNLKRIIINSGIKHSSIFKFYAEVALPSFIFELDSINNEDIDGVVVSYTKLLKHSTFRIDLRDIDNKVGYKQLNILKNLTLEKNMELFIRLDRYTDDLVKEVISLKPTGVIFADIPSEDTLKIIKAEEHLLEKSEHPNHKITS